MLRSAAVEGHGRSACRRAAIGVILVAATSAIISAQTPLPADLVAGVVARVAATVPAGSSLSLRTSSGNRDDAEHTIGPITAALTARGYRLAGPGAPAVGVTIDCADNLRETACAITTTSGPSPTTAFVIRPHSSSDTATPASLSLEMRTLFSHPSRILDLQSIGERVLLLDAAGIAIFERSDAGWQRARFAPTSSSRPWPRDLRGRVRVEGERVDVFLPGVVCSGTLALQDVACREARGPWPLGIDNVGLDPARNVFATPEGLTFFSAAVLGREAQARWLVAAGNGVLTFLDDGRRALTTAGAGDELVALADPCRSATHILARRSNAAGDDAVVLFDVTRLALRPAGASLTLPGQLTALWADPSSMRATAIVRSANAGRYEAFDIRIACTR
jgi:hypothetical protein